MWRALVCISLVACRFRFDPVARDDARAMFGDCWPAWKTGPLSLSAPQPVSMLNSPGIEGDPWLTPDALTLYFTRDRDFFAAIRTDREAGFALVAPPSELNTTSIESKLTMTADRLRVVWASNRSGAADLDLWEASRTNPTQPFAGSTQAALMTLNDTADQWDPHLSEDGLRLYYAPQVSVQGIAVATRSSIAANFGASTAVPLVGLFDAGDPAPSSDELVIVFSGHTIAGEPQNLYYATRTSTGSMFGPPQRIPGLFGPGAHAQDPVLSYDGCELYFMAAPTGDEDLYVAVVQ